MTAVAQWGSTAKHDAGARLVRLARLCAVVAFASIAVHLWMAWQHLDTPWQSLLMLAMAAFCLPCAVKSWRHGGAEPARMLMLAALAMAAFHTLLLTGAGPHGGGHTGHGVAAVAGNSAAGIGSDSIAAGQASLTAVLPHTEKMLVVILLELVAAMSAAFYLNRLRHRP